MLEQSFGPHDLVEDVFAHVGVHGAQRVVEEEDVVVAVDRPRQTDPLLLTPAQVDALDTEQRAPTSTTQLHSYNSCPPLRLMPWTQNINNYNNTATTDPRSG